MIDRLSMISTHSSVATNSRGRQGDDKIQNKEPGTERTQNERPINELKKVARDMESLFAYQLIKIMRETANAISSDKKGLGNSTYMSLFDMEISRLFAERGLGLQDAILNQLGRMPIINSNDGNIDKEAD